jgi:hypothetical protein
LLVSSLSASVSLVYLAVVLPDIVDKKMYQHG